MKKNNRLVYSTESGRIKPENPKVEKSFASADGIIRVTRESKGRNGKPVSIASGFDMQDDALKALAKKLKQICGTGGTVKEGRIEIQGDQREKIIEYLESQQFKVKKSGG